MSHSKKYIDGLIDLVESMEGFKVINVLNTKCGSGHRSFTIRDDVGNQFKMFAPTSPGSDVKRGMLNFKCDVKRMSNRLKGVIE